jgi:hypothetical protein
MSEAERARARFSPPPVSAAATASPVTSEAEPRGRGSRRARTAGVARSKVMHEIREFFRSNPQVLVLLIVVLVLGIGTFLIVVFAVATSHSQNTTGEPSDALDVLRAALSHHLL